MHVGLAHVSLLTQHTPPVHTFGEPPNWVEELHEFAVQVPDVHTSFVHELEAAVHV